MNGFIAWALSPDGGAFYVWLLLFFLLTLTLSVLAAGYVRRGR